MSDNNNNNDGCGVALAVLCVAVGGLVLGVFFGQGCGAKDAVLEVCGPCDHVGECPPYECVAGVKGWQKKAGAR